MTEPRAAPHGEGTDGHRPRRDARTGRPPARRQLPRGQPRADRAARDARGRAVPAVSEALLHRRLPGPGQHPAVHPPAARGRHERRGRLAARRQRPALRHRPGLPAGDPVRGGVPAWEEGQVGLDRRPRALRRRLGPGPPRRPPPRDADARRPHGGGRRLRPGRPHGGGRAREARLHGDGLRGVPRARWGAHLRHPRVPAPQGHRPGRGRPAARGRRRIRTERHHRQDLHARRVARAVRRGLPRRRGGAAGLHERPGREPQGRLFGERVPDPGQPDGGLDRGRRHARPEGPARGRRRRWQRRDGLGPDGAPHGRRRRDGSSIAAGGRSSRPVRRRSTTPKPRASGSNSRRLRSRSSATRTAG